MVRRKRRRRDGGREGKGEGRGSEFFLFSSAMNRTGASDSDIQSVCNTLVESLFSVFVTAGELVSARYC